MKPTNRPTFTPSLTEAQQTERSRTKRDFFARLGKRHEWATLFEHLPGVFFFVKDAQSRMMGANRAIVERFGLVDELELVGTTDYDFFPPTIADQFVADDQFVLQTGTPLLHRLEIWFNRQRVLDWFVTNKFPMLDDRGTVVGIMGTMQSYESKQDAMLPYSGIQRAVDFIRQHHRQRIFVTQLADAVGCSPRQLHRKFLDALGMSVQAFLVKTRLQAACDALLNSELTIAEIALQFGFCDQSAFTQQFRKHLGMTPLKFRKREG